MTDENTDAPVGVVALDALYWQPAPSPAPADDDELVEKLMHMAGATE